LTRGNNVPYPRKLTEVGVDGRDRMDAFLGKVIAILAKPDQYSLCTRVDFTHLPDLFASLIFISLVDAYAVSP
jgi:hypothetical protein